MWLCLAGIWVFIWFHHGIKGEQKTGKNFKRHAADFFLGEQSFSPHYVKQTDVQLFADSKKKKKTGIGSGKVSGDCVNLFYYPHNLRSYLEQAAAQLSRFPFNFIGFCWRYKYGAEQQRDPDLNLENRSSYAGDWSPFFLFSCLKCFVLQHKEQ